MLYLHLAVIQQHQRAERLAGRLAHTRQQQCQVSGNARDGRLIEVRAVVAVLQRQTVAQANGQGQRVVGLLVVARCAEAQARRSLLAQDFSDWVVLKHQQGIEQPLTDQTRPALDVVQRRVFLLAQCQVQRLQLLQALPERLLLMRGDDQRQGVDEQADLLLYAFELTRTARHRGAEAHAGLPGVALQQQCPGGLQQGVERHFLRLGEGRQCLGLCAVEPLHMLALPLADLGTHGTGQPGRLAQLGQLAAPEGFAGSTILALQPGDVVAVVAALTRGQLAVIALQHFAEQQRVAPTVHEDVVAGVDQLVALPVSQRHQDQTKQRCLTQVEALFALGKGQRRQLFRRARLDHEGQLDLAFDSLQWAAGALPDEARAQHLVALQHRLPALAEALDIQPVEGQAQLIDVDPGLRRIGAVEQHALLHRRQRIEIVDPRQGQLQRIELRLVEARERKVRRCRAAVGRVQAMVDDRLQLLLAGIDQRLDGGLVEGFTAEAEVQLQLPAIHPPFDAQPVGQRRLQALRLATALAGGDEGCLGVELLVELPQVVEGDAWLGERCQFGTGHTLAQQAVADAFVGDLAQLFLDALECRAELGDRRQAYRVEAGEPTQGTGQVDVFEQLLAAVAFELDQGRGVARPAADHPAHGGQQQVVDLGAIGGRRLLQQLPRALAVQAQAQALLQRVAVAAQRVVQRQVARSVAQLLDPVRQLAQQAFVAGIGGKTRRPLLVAAGLVVRSQWLAGDGAGVVALQVFEQHAPGNAVDHQVVQHQQQALAAVGLIDQQHPQQRAVLQVEAGLGGVAQRAQLLGRVGLTLPELYRRGRCMPLLPAVFGFGKAQAQGVVLLDQCLQCAVERSHVYPLTWCQQQRLVPVVTRGDVLLEEPALDRRQQHRPLHHTLRSQARGQFAGHLGQAAQGLIAEQVAGAQAQAGLARAADHLDRDDGIAAQFEEVVIQADFVDAEDVLPDLRQGNLAWRLRGTEHLLLPFPHPWQRLAIDLAVGRGGQLRQGDDGAGQHVVGQRLRQMGAQFIVECGRLGRHRL
ncbi:hypothetical protein D3C76_613760 [compost metagenome]